MDRVRHLRRNRCFSRSPRGTRWLLAALVSLVSLGLPDVASARTAATLTVCPTVTGAYSTIQSAVNVAAQTGDTIQVCAGNFPEQVVITKSVTLVGAGSAQTTIQLPAAPAGLQDVITVDGAGVDVEISGFTITGFISTERLAAACSQACSSAAAREPTFMTTGSPTCAPNRSAAARKGSGSGSAEASSTTSGTATITNNTISDIQKGGIVVDHTSSAATITGNTITGFRSDWGDRAERDPDLTRSDCDCHRQQRLRPTSTPALRSFSQPGCFSSARSARRPSRTTTSARTTTASPSVPSSRPAVT